MWQFTVSLHSDDTDQADVHSGARRSLRVGLPRELGGAPDVWSPEALLAASVGSSLMASFRDHLRRNGGDVRSYLSAVKATQAETREGLRITGVEVSTVMGVEGAHNLDAARHAAGLAERDCPVPHSLNCSFAVTWQVNEVANASPIGKETRDAHLRVQV